MKYSYIIIKNDAQAQKRIIKQDTVIPIPLTRGIKPDAGIISLKKTSSFNLNQIPNNKAKKIILKLQNTNIE